MRSIKTPQNEQVNNSRRKQQIKPAALGPQPLTPVGHHGYAPSLLSSNIGSSGILSRQPSSLLQRQTASDSQTTTGETCPRLQMGGRNFAQCAESSDSSSRRQATRMVGPWEDRSGQAGNGVAGQKVRALPGSIPLAQRNFVQATADEGQANPLAPSLLRTLQRAPAEDAELLPGKTTSDVMPLPSDAATTNRTGMAYSALVQRLPTYAARMLHARGSPDNQPTQQMAARSPGLRVRPASIGMLVQRLGIDDIGPHYQPFRAELWMQELLRLVTAWENQASDALEYEYRCKEARTIVNRALQSKFDFIVRPETDQERPDALRKICRQLPDLLKATLPFDRVTMLEDTLFLFGKFSSKKMMQFQAQISMLPAQAQRGLARMISSAIGFNICSFLPSFTAIAGSASECVLLFEWIAVDHSFLHLEPESQTSCIGAFFGKREQLQHNLLLLKKLNPTLALLIEPALFSTHDEGQTANLDEINLRFDSPATKAILDPVYKALGKSHALHLLHPVLRLFADFIVRSGIDDEGLAALKKTLIAILNQRILETRAELLQILIELLEADYEFEEAVGRLEWMKTHEEEVSEDNSYDEEDLAPHEDPLQEVEIVSVERAPTYIRPICLSLLSLYPPCFSNKNVNEFLASEKYNLKKSLTDRQTVLSTLLELRGCSLEGGQKVDVVSQLFADLAQIATSQAKFMVIRSVATCIKLRRTALLLTTDNYVNLSEQLTSGLHTVVGIETDALIPENLERLQDHLRTINDIITYAATLGELEDEEERGRALADLRLFVMSIIREEYQRMRYGLLDPEVVEKWGHLQTVLGIKSEALGEWMHGSGPHYQTFEHNGKNWLVMDTDAPATMFMIGSDFQTCQSIDKSVGFSKCLLSYMIDGKNRAIVVKRDDPKVPEKDRKSVARALFKVLFNPKTNTVVLFIEKLYHTNEIDGTVAQKAILSMAMQRAAAIAQFIDVDLVAEPSMAGGFSDPYPFAIHSLGGPAEFDYNDIQVQAGSPAFKIEADFTRLIGQYKK